MEIRFPSEWGLIDFLNSRKEIPLIVEAFEIDELPWLKDSCQVLVFFFYYTPLSRRSVIFVEWNPEARGEIFCSEIFDITKLEDITEEEIGRTLAYSALTERWGWDWIQVIEYILGVNEINLTYGLN